MNKKLTRYYPSGNDFVELTTPDEEQTVEKPTNKAIECRICSRMREDIVARIVVVVEDKGYNDGVCCKTCASTTRFNSDVLLLMPHEDTITTPDIIAIGQVIPTNDRGWLSDSTKGEQFIKDRDRYRNSVKNMIEINKRHGLLVPTFKQEMEKKISILSSSFLSRLSAGEMAKIRELIQKGDVKLE